MVWPNLDPWDTGDAEGRLLESWGHMHPEAVVLEMDFDPWAECYRCGEERNGWDIEVCSEGLSEWFDIGPVPDRLWLTLTDGPVGADSLEVRVDDRTSKARARDGSWVPLSLQSPVAGYILATTLRWDTESLCVTVEVPG